MAKIDKSQRPTLAINISTRRKHLGMSQSDLAEKIGIHRNTLADIERGVSEGWPDTREAIAKALGCSIAELYGRNEHPAMSPDDRTPTLSDAIEFLEAYRGAEHWQRVVAMFFLTQDETWLDELPEEQKSKLLAAR